VLQNIMWYSFDKNYALNLTPLPVDRVKEIIEINKKGKKVEVLLNKVEENIALPDFGNIVGQDSLTRFDTPKNKGNKKRRPNKKKNFRKHNSSKQEGDNVKANVKKNSGNNPSARDKKSPNKNKQRRRPGQSNKPKGERPNKPKPKE